MRVIPFFATEMQLVNALNKGDGRAQKVVYERYAGKMMAVCSRYISNRADAEEVLIDGFLKVYDKISQFRQEGSFEGWIRRVMVTESLMFLRRNKSWQQALPIDEVTAEPNYDWADVSLEANDLMELVNRLPQGYRAVFNLFAIEGYSHAEISQMLNISEGTSKSQLSRARAYLQAELIKLETDVNGQSTAQAAC